MTDPLNGHGPEDGIHILKDKWGKKSHFGQQSDCLSEHLEAAICATAKKAPLRSSLRQAKEFVYQLNRGVSVKIDSTQRERLWERAAFIRWSNNEMSPVASCWSQLVAFQVPLFAASAKGNWGYIDLMGILADGTVAIVELKKEPRAKPEGITGQSESPLRMVLEALAYAIAIKEDWDAFRPELIARLRSLAVSEKLISKVPAKPKRFKLVGVAPAAYWLDWLPLTEKGNSVPRGTWPSFSRLLTALDKANFPTSFLSLSGDPEHPESLAAQPLSPFPLYC